MTRDASIYTIWSGQFVLAIAFCILVQHNAHIDCDYRIRIVFVDAP